MIRAVDKTSQNSPHSDPDNFLKDRFPRIEPTTCRPNAKDLATLIQTIVETLSTVAHPGTGELGQIHSPMIVAKQLQQQRLN